MFDTDLHRRRVIVLAGTTTVIGLAGCTTAPPSADEGSGDETTQTPTEPTDEADDHHDDAPHDDGDHHDDDDHHEADDHHEDETPHEDEGHVHDETLDGPVDHAEVGMLTSSTGQHFEPHLVWVTVGGTVTWRTESGVHTTTSYSPENDRPQLIPDGVASWDSGIITEQDGTFEHTFETEGVYHYFCIPHEFVGMIGSVIVGTPDPAGQLALEEPPESLADPVRESIAQLNARIIDALGDDDYLPTE